MTRRRGVVGGEALVRTLLLVGLPKSSLERAAKMAGEAGLAQMNPTALFNRLRKSEQLLKDLFFHTLTHSVDSGERLGELRLLAVDATCLCGPAPTGTDQKLHTVYDLGKGLPLSLELTGPEGGEALWKHRSFGSGDLVLADSGYGYNRSFLWALRSGASILIRFNFETVKLYAASGARIWAEEVNKTVPEEDPLDIDVFLPDWPSPLRAVGSRNDQGECVWLLTDLDREKLPTLKVRQLYRRRWQVELFFKRLKSLLDLDELPTRDGPTARPWIWAKLLLASLAILMAHERFSPWGIPTDERDHEQMAGVRLRSVGDHKGAVGARRTKTARQAKGKAKTARSNTSSIHALEA